MTVDNSLQGQVLAGKYRVERVLGQGGMGVVLAAKHIHLEERVAVKLMLSEAAFNPEAVARFLREARAAARLESAHVARVTDVGTLEDGRPYMVMEYLDGQDLSQVLASTGPLAIGDAVDYVLQASEAIAEAHSIGIVHRDLKPSNLFLTRRRDRTPLVKVLDFGISKVSGSAMSASDNAMTKTSAMMGSPLYMSPEQMTSIRDVDGRADIWALGIILFELVTGSPPFMGETLPQVCGLVLQGATPTLGSRRAGVPQELEAVVACCLAKSADNRFQNVAALAVALRGLAGRYGRASIERILMLAGGEAVPPSVPPAAVPPGYGMSASGHYGPPAVANSAIQGTHAAWGETRPPQAKPNRTALVLVVAAALLVPLLATGTWLVLRSPLSASTEPVASASVAPAAQPTPAATLAAQPTLAPITASPAEPPSAHAADPAPPIASAPARTNVPGTPQVAPKATPKAPLAAANSRPATAATAKSTFIVAPKSGTTEVKKPASMGGRL